MRVRNMDIERQQRDGDHVLASGPPSIHGCALSGLHCFWLRPFDLALRPQSLMPGGFALSRSRSARACASRASLLPAGPPTLTTYTPTSAVTFSVTKASMVSPTFTSLKL